MLPLSSFSICNGPRHPLYSTYVLDSPHVEPLSRSSLVFPLVLDPQLHAPYISSPSHRHLFATHDRTPLHTIHDNRAVRETRYPFSASTLLVGRQEGHPACKKLSAGVVICLERGADLHTAQLMPLPLTVSCFSKIQISFTFPVPTHPGKKGKGSPYSITERRVPELIPVLGSQPAGDVSHKPGGRLPLLSERPLAIIGQVYCLQWRITAKLLRCDWLDSIGLLLTRPQSPSQPLRGLLPILLLGEQRHDGCEQFA